MLRVLTPITFVYVQREDRVTVAINAGRADSWSCWLTRRLALAVLQRGTEYLVSTSDLAQRAPAEFRGEAVAFEREAAIVKTAPAMSSTPRAVLKASTDTAELAERLTISREGDAFRLELGRTRSRRQRQSRRAATHSTNAVHRRRAGELAPCAGNRPGFSGGSSEEQNRPALSPEIVLGTGLRAALALADCAGPGVPPK